MSNLNNSHSDAIIIEQLKTQLFNNLDKGHLTSLDDILHTETDSIITHELRTYFTQWYQSLSELNFLNMNHPELEEVIIHSSMKLTYKTNTKKMVDDTDLTQIDIQKALEILCLKNSISWNYSNPFVSFFAVIQGKKVRVSLTHFCLCPQRVSRAFIRLSNESELTLDNFKTGENRRFLEDIISSRKNILIAGATGSGKTSFLNTLLKHTDSDDHLLILEDTFELNSPTQKTTRLLSLDDQKNADLSSYLKYAMRMSPDRIVLGEMRAHEVEPYLLSMNTGHKGVLSTIHANNAKDALTRLALLFKIYSGKDLSYELVLKIVCTNLDYVIYLKDKKVEEIIEVFGSENESLFFEKVA